MRVFDISTPKCQLEAQLCRTNLRPLLTVYKYLSQMATVDQPCVFVVYLSFHLTYWHVKMPERAEGELRDLLQKGLVTKNDVKVLLRWLDEMEEFGPEFIAGSKEWHDHALDRDWAGYRSSAF